MEYKSKTTDSDKTAVYENNMVTISNDFVNARYSLTITETRLFLLALAQISPQDEDLKLYKIHLSDFVEKVGNNSNACRGDKYINSMQPAAKALISKVISIRQKDGRPSEDFNLISIARYGKDHKGAFVELGFNTYIKPDLIRLKNNFLSHDLRYTITCKSNYSIRIYQLLKQYRYKGERTETIKDLKYKFALEKDYSLYSNFKRKIILVAQKELKEKSDIYFDFEEIKEGRAVTAIKFLIFNQTPSFNNLKQKTKSIQNESQPTTGTSRPQQEQQPGEQHPLIKRLISLGFNEQQTKEIIKQQTPEFITANADILEELQRQGRINTNIPAFSKGFTKDFRPTKSAHEIEQEARQEQAKAEAERIAKAKAEQAKADDLGKTIYNKSLEIYTEIFFSNTEQNSEFIKDFENRYIKTGVGAMLFKKRPETAKTAFIQTNKQIDINTEVIKIAESAGYILTFDGIQWQAVEDNQEKLFPID